MVFIGAGILLIPLLDPSGTLRDLRAVDWMMFIVIGTVLARTLTLRGLRPIGLAVILFLAMCRFSNPVFLDALHNIPSFGRPALSLGEKVAERIAISAVNIRAQKHLPDYGFFDLLVLTYGNDRVRDESVWVFLEKELGVPTELHASDFGVSLSSISTREYLYLVCLESQGTWTIEYSGKACISDVAAREPGYDVQETIFESPEASIYLMHQK